METATADVDHPSGRGKTFAIRPLGQLLPSRSCRHRQHSRSPQPDDGPSGRSGGPLILVGHSFRRLADAAAGGTSGSLAWWLIDAADETYNFSAAGLKALERNRVHGLKYGWAARLGALRALAAV
jgi:hypothetical protein